MTMRVSTRYEVRPCEPGIRVRTELYNGGREYQSWVLADGFYWGGRRNLPVPAVIDQVRAGDVPVIVTAIGTVTARATAAARPHCSRRPWAGAPSR